MRLTSSSVDVSLLSAVPNEGEAGTDITLSAPATADGGALTFSRWVVTEGDGTINGNVLTLGLTDCVVDAVYEATVYNVGIEGNTFNETRRLWGMGHERSQLYGMCEPEWVAGLRGTANPSSGVAGTSCELSIPALVTSSHIEVRYQYDAAGGNEVSKIYTAVQSIKDVEMEPPTIVDGNVVKTVTVPPGGDLSAVYSVPLSVAAFGLPISAVSGLTYVGESVRMLNGQSETKNLFIGDITVPDTYNGTSVIIIADLIDTSTGAVTQANISSYIHENDEFHIGDFESLFAAIAEGTSDQLLLAPWAEVIVALDQQ